MNPPNHLLLFMKKTAAYGRLKRILTGLLLVAVAGNSRAAVEQDILLSYAPSYATSLGGVESTLERRSRWAAEQPDVPASLIRLSVGCEDVEDLWSDLLQSLTASR